MVDAEELALDDIVLVIEDDTELVALRLPVVVCELLRLVDAVVDWDRESEDVPLLDSEVDKVYEIDVEMLVEALVDADDDNDEVTDEVTDVDLVSVNVVE